MSKVFFEPWIGKNYYDGINGHRVMVMGHDHVCDGCDKCGIVAERGECAYFTQKVVRDYIDWRETGVVPTPDYDGWLQTYFNFAKCIFGYEPEYEEERHKFWDRILFCNFLQVAVPQYNIQAPDEAYIQAQDAFIELINKHQPDLIIAWGNGAYDYTPAYNGRDLDPLIVEEVNLKAERYEYTLESGKKCVMIKVHHPSMYFSPTKWHEVIKRTLLV